MGEIDWGYLSLAEQIRLAARYLGCSESEVTAQGLAQTADWIASLGPSQRHNLFNHFFALGGGDLTIPARRALWDGIKRVWPGQYNSHVGEVSLLLELVDAEQFRQAGKAAGLREDITLVRWWYHRGASFSLREWGVRASLNIANDTAAARAMGEPRGGGNFVRAEFDAHGPSWGPLSWLKHLYGRMDVHTARVELVKRGLMPEVPEVNDAASPLNEIPRPSDT